MEIIVLSKNYNTTLVYDDFNITDVDWADFNSSNTKFWKLVELLLESDMQQQKLPEDVKR